MRNYKALLALAVVFCGSCAFAQTNCSIIQNFLTGDKSVVTGVCDTHFNKVITETQTYNVQCINQNNNSTYLNTTSQMTSTGSTSLFCSGDAKIECAPTFQTQNQNAGFTDSTDNINRFFLRVWSRTSDSLGESCVQTGFSQDLKQCAAQPCQDPTPTPTPPPPAPTPTPCSNPDGTPELRFGHTDGETPNPCASPIIIDTSGSGYHLTSAANGVLFDIAGTGTPIHLGWTQPGSGNAFLVLPRADGSVTNGQQLFGNFTPQPPSATPNGYAALAVYDQPDHGGNSDGVIDQNDQIFSSLRLWLDENHDGVCQPEELHTLPQLGVFSISLDYSLSKRTDDFGNVFRYRAGVNQGIHKGSDPVDRKAYDVFFVTQ